MFSRTVAQAQLADTLFSQNLPVQVYVDPPGFSCPGVPLVPIISVFFNMVLFAQVCAALFWFSSQIQYLKKIIYGVALLTSVYHQIPMTDGNDTLFDSYMKKRGIDLSFLVSSLWEFMPAMVSTMLFLPAQNTLLLVTMAFLLKPHELCSSPEFFEHTVRYQHTPWSPKFEPVAFFLMFCTVHTLVVTLSTPICRQWISQPVLCPPHHSSGSLPSA